MRYIFSFSLLLFVSCDDALQQSYDRGMEEAAEEKLRAHAIPKPLAASSAYITEPITDQLATQIEESLVEFAETDGFPSGFQRIEDVRFDWLNVAGFHSRRAEAGDLFFFPRLDVSREDEGWQSGIALRRGSNIVYRWKLDTINAEQGGAHQPLSRSESESE
ncbi:hypothetical protein NT6N_04360 [Oceaniferula spumae]|uniref:DUF4864 domain-containing protein n=1 Tax=Oceaniferula spumae TaxID=2979115 RepID=A0AAT9FHE9_9BACT